MAERILCEICGRSIAWVPARNRERVAVDPDVVEFSTLSDGERLITQEGAVVTMGLEHPSAIFKGYIPHSQTCDEPAAKLTKREQLADLSYQYSQGLGPPPSDDLP